MKLRKVKLLLRLCLIISAHQFIGSSPYFEIIDTVIRQRADIAHASSKGLSVWEYSIVSKADIEYKSLSSEIKKIIFK